MKCTVTRVLDCEPGCDPKLVTRDARGRPVVAVGTLIDEAECPTAECVRLVRSGHAVPADDECRDACRMTAGEIAAAQLAVMRMHMIPEDEFEDEYEEEEDE